MNLKVKLAIWLFCSVGDLICAFAFASQRMFVLGIVYLLLYGWSLYMVAETAKEIHNGSVQKMDKEG